VHAPDQGNLRPRTPPEAYRGSPADSALSDPATAMRKVASSGDTGASECR